MPLTEIGSEDVETTINVEHYCLFSNSSLLILVGGGARLGGVREIQKWGGGGVYICAQLLQPTYIYL